MSSLQTACPNTCQVAQQHSAGNHHELSVKHRETRTLSRGPLRGRTSKTHRRFSVVQFWSSAPGRNHAHLCDGSWLLPVTSLPRTHYRCTPNFSKSRVFCWNVLELTVKLNVLIYLHVCTIKLYISHPEQLSDQPFNNQWKRVKDVLDRGMEVGQLVFLIKGGKRKTVYLKKKNKKRCCVSSSKAMGPISLLYDLAGDWTHDH